MPACRLAVLVLPACLLFSYWLRCVGCVGIACLPVCLAVCEVKRVQGTDAQVGLGWWCVVVGGRNPLLGLLGLPGMTIATRATPDGGEYKACLYSPPANIILTGATGLLFSRARVPGRPFTFCTTLRPA